MKAAVLPTFKSVKIAKKEMNFLVSFVLKTKLQTANLI